ALELGPVPRCPPCLLGAEHRNAYGPGSVHTASLRGQELDEVVLRIGDPAAAHPRQAGPGATDDGGHVVRAPGEPVVDRLGQVSALAQVDEGRRRHQHEQHGEGESCREPNAYRQTAEDQASFRSRYPAPRTVSIDSTPKGRSTFSRR